jgi:glutaminyl-peptide cyclotransferase
VRLALAIALCCLSATALAVEQLTVEVVGRKAQDPQHWVQGLEIHDGKMYLSAGRYGESKLLRYSFDTGKPDVTRALNPRLFAEGLTVLDERVYQLTWKAGAVLVFAKRDLKPLEYFKIPGEGWGLTNNGSQLIYSDGSAQLHYLSPETRTITHSITVTENGKPLARLNELEWIDGKVWANIWYSQRIVVIDPESGAVSASIDLAGKLPELESQPRDHVLNGIARDARDGSIWVTGKRWPWQYRIETVPARATPSAAESR